MGRIVFNADVFRPSQLRAPRQPESRSTIGDQWLTPRGVLTAATLAKMAGGLKLPAGWRDEGVDANTEALKAAATARQQAKDKIEKDESDARARRAADTSDEAAMQMSADIKPGTLAAMRDETKVRALSEARQLMADNRFEDAREILSRAGIEGGLRGLRVAGSGDRIDRAMSQVTPQERMRRERMEQPRDLRRLRRQAETGGLPSTPSGLRPEAVDHADSRGEWDFQTGKWTKTPYSQSPRADEARRDLARAQAEYEKRNLGKDEPSENVVFEQETIVAPADVDPFEKAGLAINLDDLKGEGSEKVRNMSRDQLRDILVKWKQGDKEAVMSEISNLQGDQQEVAAFEELLIRQMNRRRSQEAGVRGVDRLMTEAEEAKISEEAADKFLADKRRDDPYYGMRPEDAVRQIMVDAPLAKTEQQQRKLRSLMQKYTPKRQTFADLFFDNTNERSMANIANLNKLLPDPEKELTKLERAKQTLDLIKLTHEEEFLKALKPEEREKMLGLRLLKAQVDKAEAQVRKVKSAIGSRNKGGAIKALEIHRKSFDKDTDAKFKIDALRAKASALLKRTKSKDGGDMLRRFAKATRSEVQEMSRDTALSPEAQKALDELAGALAARDRYVAEAGDALTRAQAAAVAGKLDLAGREFGRYTQLTNETHIDLLNRTEEITNKIVDTLKAAMFGRSR
jgi:hypothetical protein